VRYQNKDYWCGPASLQNALRALGRRVSQESLAAICGTTEDGTDESDLLGAMDSMDILYSQFLDSDRALAGQWLTHRIGLGMPVLMCVDAWTHWVCVIGMVGDRFILIDSERTPNNQRENGVHILKTKTLLRRWRAGRKVAGSEGRFYGICLHPLPRES